jgi:hypothetical protein
MNGRDLSDYTFYSRDGSEYLEAAGSLYVSEDAVKPLYPGKKSSVTIPGTGYAKWYSVSDKSAGKTLKVKLPAHGSFAVYDEKGTCAYFSVIGGEHQVTLPVKGTLVFAGEAGAKFELSVK